MIAAAGKVDPGHILLLAEALFGDLATAPPPPVAPAAVRRRHRVRPTGRRADASRLRLSGPSGLRPTAPALSLFAQAVGGGMSSRLFQELREERGLAYSIYAWTQGFADTGLFAVNLSADKARAAEAMALARDTVERAAEELTEAELNRARAQVEAGILMALETPQGRADSMARSIEIFGRIMTRRGNAGRASRGRRRRRRARPGRRCSTARARMASIGGKLALAA